MGNSARHAFTPFFPWSASTRVESYFRGVRTVGGGAYSHDRPRVPSRVCGGRFSVKRLLVLIATTVLIALVPAAASADDNEKLQARPFTFVGSAADCAPAPAGSRIVTAAWLGGMGLPDSGGNNAPDPATRNDPHFGLLLSKNGPTTDCSSAGAR